MKTVFRIGMEVYDQVNNPNKKGKVLDIKEDEICHKIHSYDYPIEVQFEGNKELDYYDLEGCPVWSYNPTLSTSPYTLQGFEQKAPTPTYDSVRTEKFKKGEYVSILNGIELPDEKTAKAFEALSKLIWLRDYYNDDWQPDWDINKVKYIIKCHGNRHFSNIETSENHPSVLYFKSKEIRDKFLKEQRELLEIAKPLL